ncbi:MAG: aminodeoxychorismate/anthranilate synthase component II [Candidatus Marinimicrobia bacterium]|jgi:para-aminobenzoate synthetase component 2|nr:aminodeoxychorismate/anthranilate synthase component II [Candidatus Neomarinimicrobiota bacterium]MCK9483555.1 aminodeoxychorismate/anthranilate synthase component II [Candidatus Neomarinimicrobiota bacterium]MCK9558969.1 aminodeoxychorismate/anthranilate synthase component II [Candidatus Neomarinimicrobiota bacterium]
MILFIDNYDSFTYNLVDYFGQMTNDLKVVRNDQIDPREIGNLNPDGIVISPGPGSPDDAGISCEVIRISQRRFPIFGVCLGYQAIAQVFGAKVVRAPFPVHGKTAVIQHTVKGIFENIQSPLIAARYHSLIVERASLPDCFTVEAESADHLVMAIAHKEFPIWGVQFHPESILTPDGMQILRNWLELTEIYKRQTQRSKS